MRINPIHVLLVLEWLRLYSLQIALGLKIALWLLACTILSLAENEVEEEPPTTLILATGLGHTMSLTLKLIS